MYLIVAMMQKEIMLKEEKGDPIISCQYLLVALPDNPSNVTVHVAHDADTLNILNYARYATRTELYYEDMGAEGLAYASYPDLYCKSGRK